MKNFRYLFLIGFISLMVPACVEDTAPEDVFGTSPNLVSFQSTGVPFSAISNGEEYPKEVSLRVKGPSLDELDAPVTATISVDEEASTAIEGTHYRIESNTITFSPENDYLANLPIVMLTEGIIAPLPENPVLVLNIESVSGEDNVIANGKQLTITFNYLCYEDLTGTYSVVIPIPRCQNATYGPNYPVEGVTISKNPDGSWFLSSADGTFLGNCTANSGLDNSGNIVVVCGEVQPSDDLEYGSLGIGNITGGQWDAVNGVLTLEHSQTFTPNWPSSYTSVYTRQD